MAKHGDLSSLLKTWDLAVRAGEGGKVREALQSLSFRNIRREDRCHLANLCYRLHLCELGLRILKPYVQPSERKPERATPEEIAEFAACLLRLGARQEAYRYLKSIPPNSTASGLLYEAFYHVSEWDYAGSIPLLKSYLSFPQLNWYQRILGQVNLAAALVFDRQDLQATYLLRETLHECMERKALFLVGRALELSAELHYHRKEWEQAQVFLTKSEELLKESGTLDYLFVKKFQTLIRLQKDGANALPEVEGFMREASQLSHWESVRSCLHDIAIRLEDNERFNFVYFGTPYAHYRSRLLREVTPKLQLKSAYSWNVSGKSQAQPLALPQELRDGGLCHRLFQALTSDFIRPFRSAKLFDLCYPGERFVPQSAGVRVRQVIWRLRSVFHSHKLPLDILEDNESYRLVATKPVEILVTPSLQSPTRMSSRMESVRQQFPNGFSTRQVADKLKISYRSAVRLVNEALANGEIDKRGSGANQSYVWTTPGQKESA